jgi:predicted Zn finger-like uncharacterized protein
MNVSCPSCATVYRVDPAKVPPAGVRARCQICAAVFPVRRAAEVEETPRPVAVSAAAAPLPPSPRITAPAQMPPIEERPAPMPPRAVASAPAHEAPAESAPEPQRATEPRVPSPAGRPMVGGAPVPPVRPTVPARPAAPVGAQPPVVRPTTQGGVPPSAPVASPTRLVPPSSSPAAAPPRPANPFLNQDPGQKARRLARALVSDLAVYFPDRRKKALASGTLKQEFEEEIRKSWEEYTDQVGKDLAGASSHFNDALNEILAGGQKIF